MSIALMIFPDAIFTISSSRTTNSGLAAISTLFTTLSLFRVFLLMASVSQESMQANMELTMLFATFILKIENSSIC